MPKARRPAENLSAETDDYIAQHYGRGQITAREVAAALGVSLSTLYRAVQRPGFKARLRAVRIGRACELLRNSDLSIQDIARGVGYPNTSALDHDFDRLLHQPPRTFRDGARSAAMTNSRKDG